MYKRIRCGDVVDRVQTYVGRQKPERSSRSHESSEAQQECNRRQSIRELTRLLNCNLDQTWLSLVLTYDDQHQEPSAEEAERNAVNFWRRLSRLLGPECRPIGIWLTADKDSRTGAARRIHHHVVLDPAGITLKDAGDHLEAFVGDRPLEAVWGRGFVKVRRVEQDKTYKAFADYLVKQSVSGKNHKRWHASHGLQRPIVEAIEFSDTRMDLRPPVGAEVLERSEFDRDSVSELLVTWEPKKSKSKPARQRKRRKPKLSIEQKRKRGFYSKKRE